MQAGAELFPREKQPEVQAIPATGGRLAQAVASRAA